MRLKTDLSAAYFDEPAKCVITDLLRSWCCNPPSSPPGFGSIWTAIADWRTDHAPRANRRLPGVAVSLPSCLAWAVPAGLR